MKVVKILNKEKRTGSVGYKIKGKGGWSNMTT
jgi:hypothetical protein